MGHVEALQLLLEAGADAEAQDRNGLTPLHCAVENGQPKSMQLLLEAGPDKEAQNRQGYTSLHATACNGDAEAMQLLLEAGADKDDKDHNHGENATPLFLAAAFEHAASAFCCQS